jgi:hypothetical protein
MGKKYKDVEIGDVYGCWTVLEDFEYRIIKGKNRTRKLKYYKCQCYCDLKTIKYIERNKLVNKNHISCGKHYPKKNDVFKKENINQSKQDNKNIIHINEKFGRWTVIDDKYIYKKVSKKNRKFYKCECSCENKTVKYINENSLIQGISTSCGCYRKEILSKVRRNSKYSLLDINPEVNNLWSHINTKSPSNFSPMSSKEVWWKCENEIHEDYKRVIGNSVMASFRCPHCVRERRESFLQEKVRIYLSERLNYKLNHEYNCSIVPINPKTKQRLPFDNEVIDLHLIIEVNGIQHYKLLSEDYSWLDNKKPEEYLRQRKLIDRYKKAVAERNGYSYLVIPYWTDDKNENYKTLIDNKIQQLLNNAC